MFQNTKTTSAAYIEVRRIAIAAIWSCAFISIVAQAFNHVKIKKMQNQIYALSTVKPKQSYAVTTQENLNGQAKDDIRGFSQYLFNLNPESWQIDRSTAKAYNLADHPAKKVFGRLSNQEFYNQVINQRITIDDMRLILSQVPYSFRHNVTLKRIRSRGKISRNFLTTGNLKSFFKSNQHPYGLQIENWKVVQNPPLHHTKPITHKLY